MNRHDFQLLAKSFRAGRVSLDQFTEKVFPAKASGHSRAIDSPELPLLPLRDVQSHKGDFGRVLLIGGSVGMAGAIGLAGQAALRAGAGMVKVVVPEPIQTCVASYSSCYMTLGCPSHQGGFGEGCIDLIQREVSWADVIVLGPGMGRGSVQQDLVQTLYRDISQTLVVDADALNALAEQKVKLAIHAASRVLTPHTGELQRLLGRQLSSRLECEQAAMDLASKNEIVIVLKGNRSLIADGQQSFRNETGNPGMATGGSGDVLSGMIGALLGQRMNPLEATRLAVHWHGLAGDLAADHLGQHSLIATDLIDWLPAAAKRL